MSTRTGIRVVILARSSRTMPIPCLVCSQDVAAAPTIINACGHEYHASCLPRARAYNILTCGICQAPLVSPTATPLQPAPALQPAPQLLTAQQTVGVLMTEDSLATLADPPNGTATAALSIITEAVDRTHMGKFYGIVELSIGALVGATTPIDLVVQCDASSSMTGDKARMMKNSLLALLDELTERDRLSIVRFSNRASCLQSLKLMTVDNKASARQIIDQMVISGNTNIGDAVHWTEDILERRTACNPATGVILLSDGQDTYGYQFNSNTKLCTTVPVYSLGIGEDHDYRLLGKASELSGAVFQYASSPEAIPGAIGATVGTLKTCVGHNGVLRIGAREYAYRTVYADMVKTELFEMDGGEMDAVFTYTNLNGDQQTMVQRLVLPDEAEAPQTEANLLRICEARNNELVKTAIEAATDQSDVQAKATLEAAKATVLASMAKDSAATKLLVEDLDFTINNLRDRAQMASVQARMTTQTGGALGMTPSMDATALRMTQSATQHM
jgi:uncharacterized protein YegL